MLGGWSLRGIARLQDGSWFRVYLTGDTLDIGSYHSQWPDKIRDPNLPVAQRTPSRWFDTETFNATNHPNFFLNRKLQNR